MTRFLWLLGIVLVTGCAGVRPTAPTNYVPPSTNKLGVHISSAQEHAVKTSDAVKAAAAKAASAKQRIKAIQLAVKDQPPVLTLAVQVEGDIDSLTQSLLDASNEVTALQGQLVSAQTEKAVVQGQVNEQTVLLNQANTERNAAVTQSKIDRGNAHKFKAILIILATLAVGVVMFGIFGVKAFVPPLVWVTIGAPTAIGIFLFFWLGSG